MNILDYAAVLILSFLGSVLGIGFWMWLEKDSLKKDL